jgi:cytosine/adenosine deaminase-related metal-dependent hydrolase
MPNCSTQKAEAGGRNVEAARARGPVLHRAPWLVTMTGPAIPNGAVLVRENRIVAVGPWQELSGEAGAVVDHPGQVLMPPLVNAHIHLELSHLAPLAGQHKGQPFVDWLATMLPERERCGATGPHVEEAMRAVLHEQWQQGVFALADIGNTGLNLQIGADFPGILLPFVEYLGLTRKSLVPALKKLAREDATTACTAHAPYSTHPELIRALKERARTRGALFPVHVAEPPSERDLLGRGRGEMADFLRQRGFYEDVFSDIDSQGSVRYVHTLGVLDSRTLLVHCVHLDDGELELIAASRAKVCLCPGSNRFLQVGLPPVAAMLEQGILPALGTDSAASNPRLSLWREMQLVAGDHPGIRPVDIVRMATLGGARALGLHKDIGTLAPGRRAAFLAVTLPRPVNSRDSVYEYLVQAGEACQVCWADREGNATWPG